MLQQYLTPQRIRHIRLTLGAFLCLLVLSFSHSIELPKPIVFSVDEFVIDGSQPLEDDEVNAFLESYAGKAYSLDELLEVASALESLIRNKGFAFYRVVVPPQSVSSSTVTLQVVQFKLKNIFVDGNEYFSEANITQSIPGLKTGSSPNTEDLAHELKVANHHPDKNLKLTFKQSDTVDWVDAQVEVWAVPKVLKPINRVRVSVSDRKLNKRMMI